MGYNNLLSFYSLYSNTLQINLVRVKIYMQQYSCLMMSQYNMRRAHIVHTGWSSSLHCQELMFEVGHRSQGGIIHINYNT